mmetsp:Transcript_149791/g.481114  ORF Transcript_149791/g.481114 Transcript_149791/m.481114 type:complete len:261 (+) Transcript_149791:1012-1794(+)
MLLLHACVLLVRDLRDGQDADRGALRGLPCGQGLPCGLLVLRIRQQRRDGHGALGAPWGRRRQRTRDLQHDLIVGVVCGQREQLHGARGAIAALRDRGDGLHGLAAHAPVGVVQPRQERLQRHHRHIHLHLVLRGPGSLIQSLKCLPHASAGAPIRLLQGSGRYAKGILHAPVALGASGQRSGGAAAHPEVAVREQAAREAHSRGAVAFRQGLKRLFRAVTHSRVHVRQPLRHRPQCGGVARLRRAAQGVHGVHADQTEQ